MTVKYLATTIIEAKQTDTPRYGTTAMGYSVPSGAPTSWLIRLDGEKIWRRLMCWCFSNVGTLFVRIKGESLIVNEYDIPRNEVKRP